MGREQDRAARRLVHAARLHADKAVLDEVDAADAVGLAERVQFGEQRGRRKFLAVDADGIASLEADANVGRPVRRIHRGDRALIDDRRRFQGRVLQHLALGRRVQEVGIDRERRLALLVLGDRDLVLARKRDQLLTALEVPLAPRGNDPDRRLERVVGQLEADLVVALAGGAMRHRIGADLAGDLDLLLGDERPGDRGPEQVLPLVQGVGAEHREHIVADEFLAQVLDEDVLRLDPEQQRLLARRAQLFALAEVGGKRHHLAAVGGLQPFQNDRGVKPAGIGEHHLLGRGLGHQKNRRETAGPPRFVHEKSRGL